MMTNATGVLRLKIRFWVIGLVLLGLSIGFGTLYTLKKNELILCVDTVNARAFTAVNEYSQKISQVLEQIQLASPEKFPSLAADMNTLCGGAKEGLAILPVNENGRRRLQRFFTESSEYITYVSSKLMASGGALPSAEEYAVIKSYNEYIEKFCRNLTHAGIEQDITQRNWQAILGELQIDTPPQIAITQTAFADPSPPACNYKITEREARNIAQNYMNTPIKLKRAETPEAANYYRFTSDCAFADILYENGLLLRMSIDRKVGSPSLSEAEALIRIESLLLSERCKNMKLQSYDIQNGRFNAEYVKTYSTLTHGIVYCENKSIAVGISLDNGRITYYNGADYYNNDFEFDMPDRIISAETAREKVKTSRGTVIINGCRLVLISDGNNNSNVILCYKVDCEYPDTYGKVIRYFSYINAVSGVEERYEKAVYGKIYVPLENSDTASAFAFIEWCETH